MKVCIITVDYGKSGLTEKLCASILEQEPHGCSLEMVVLENSGRLSLDDYQFIGGMNEKGILTHVNFVDNLGYFGTAAAYIDSIDRHMFDWLIVCNNDLVFDRFFFKILADHQQLCDKSLVCPSVIEDGFDVNPLSRYKFPRYKLFFWDFYYGSKSWAKLYEIIRLPVSRFKVRVRSFLKIRGSAEGDIHLGYGAIYLIRPNFIDLIGGLPAVTFLYQEESVLCGVARRINVFPYFVPSLKVFHESHATLKSLNFTRDYQLRRESWWKTRDFLL